MIGKLSKGITAGEKVMIVLELCEKGALRENLRKVLPWNLKVRICLDIAYGIDFLHQQGIIHRYGAIIVIVKGVCSKHS
jgi:serine/threonine protein kinase